MLYGCNSGITGQVYHNTTARYNAYFYANESLKEVNKSIIENHKDDYDDILSILPELDTTHLSSQKEKIEDIIIKASLSIQRHPDSKWMDDCYILVGISRIYLSEFPNAIETFKFVNTKSNDDNAKHQALIKLMYAFTVNKEYNNARAVEDHLRKAKFNEKNKKDFLITRAYLYQQLEDYPKVADYLTEAAPMLKKSDRKARLLFILGQVNQEILRDAEAYASYRACLKSNPSYELTFHSKLNMAQVATLENFKNIAKIEKYFKKLLKDPKNEEYKDKIHYEIGRFAQKQGDLDKAIYNYEQSVQVSKNNNKQKGYSYWKLGLIYYDEMREFNIAKAYYDSILQVLPKEDENYLAIEGRHEILERFVVEYDIIQENDSLLKLAEMDSITLANKIEGIIQKEEEEAKEERRRKRREEALANANTGNNSNFLDPFNKNTGNFGLNNTTSSGDWYFYDMTAVSMGQNEFKRQWGKRELQDSWHRMEAIKANRANAEATSEENEQEQIAEAEKPEETIKSKKDRENARVDRFKTLYANIPFSQNQKQACLDKMEVAYYELGKIYHFDLHDTTHASQTFGTLTETYPSSEYRPESLYMIYLLNNNNIDNELANSAKNTILTEYPNSIYAKLIHNPKYREESNAQNEKLKVVYANAYQFYQIDSLNDAIKIIQSVKSNPENSGLPAMDKIELLDILILGKKSGRFAYQHALQEYIDKHPEGTMTEYAQKLLQTVVDFDKNQAARIGTQYIFENDLPHKMAIIYASSEKELADILPQKLNAVIQTFDDEQKDRLTTSNMTFNNENNMIIVNGFKDYDEAEVFFTKLEEEKQLLKGVDKDKIHTFVISNDNFDILYKTKDLKAYKEFVKKNYTKAHL
ncbi:type IX secretion system periplasmic lipoprotein PorW/SprE [Aureibacter tunicatorum]|uniref:Tetratricopeptide (TPR) repeat protein n=1 Tax=Aureibacter tunicatorum TaxID=866807 RepID=A0AAE3XGI4_9BACT|nr:hypothetical protein [Aureibacter tunicatorum]MDR6237201.1 tetratricopeptide (TPR) repeat protein [Aureibacter tunicatorum]